ncbi:MAG: hypothetical protein KKH67_09020, partial [candidate division Zixibacteria bacterium]|nr:hypothetical protein [candidate division Zixibacteria bacterium]
MTLHLALHTIQPDQECFDAEHGKKQGLSAAYMRGPRFQSGDWLPFYIGNRRSDDLHEFGLLTQILEWSFNFLGSLGILL